MEAEIYKQYEDYLTDIQKFTEEEIVNEPNVLVEKLARTASYIASLGKCTADCKKSLNEAKNKVFEGKDGKALLRTPPTIVGELLKAKCRDEIFLCDWCDRLGATLVHQADALRTLISYAKHEASLFNSGANQNIK